MTEKKKTTAEPTTFNVAGWADQMRDQNQRFIAETEKTMKQVMAQSQRMFEETQKTMTSTLETQMKLQQEWMTSMMDAAKNISANQ